MMVQEDKALLIDGATNHMTGISAQNQASRSSEKRRAASPTDQVHMKNIES